MTDNTRDLEQALLERVRAGDDDALDELLAVVQPRLFRFSMKMCRHREDAEDVLQNSLLSVARSVDGFRGASSLSTWLYTVARSFCIKQRRKKAGAPDEKVPLHDLSDGDRQRLCSPTPDPEDSATNTEALLEVQNAIGAIKPELREVLVLRDVEGLRTAQVAEITGLSESAVKSRLHRARAALRENMDRGQQQPAPGCPDIRQAFSRHLEGELTSDLCINMQAHVAICPRCANECDALKRALHVCSTAPDEVPGDVQRRVRQALRAAIRGAE